jgi:Uma2 family endonuclease
MLSPVEQLLASSTLPETVETLVRALTREQMLRQKFYHDITPENKWEFINGEAILHSPALHRYLLAAQRLNNLLRNYVSLHGLGVVHTEKAMCSFPRNDYEPDIVFFGKTKAALFGPDTLRFPVPDFIVEVLSSTTEARDRGVKMADYAAHGVAEYWIIDPEAETVEQYLLANDAYPSVEARSDGSITSEAIAGFVIPIRAIFDEAVNSSTLRSILQSTVI